MNVNIEHTQQILEQLSEPETQTPEAGVPWAANTPIKTKPEGTDSGTFKTVVLSANNPYKMALPEDNTRSKAVLIALDNPVVLCHAEEQAQDSGNQVTNVPAPNGGYLPVNVPVPVTSHGVVFVAATTTNTTSRIFVSIERDEC